MPWPLPSSLFSSQPIPLCFLALVFKVQLKHIFLRDPFPALAVDAVEVDLASAVGVAVGSLVDGAAAQVAGFLYGHVVAKAAVDDTVGVHWPRTDCKQVSAHAVALRVHVVETCDQRKTEGRGRERPSVLLYTPLLKRKAPPRKMKAVKKSSKNSVDRCNVTNINNALNYTRSNPSRCTCEKRNHEKQSVYYFFSDSRMLGIAGVLGLHKKQEGKQKGKLKKKRAYISLILSKLLTRRKQTQSPTRGTAWGAIDRFKNSRINYWSIPEDPTSPQTWWTTQITLGETGGSLSGPAAGQVSRLRDDKTHSYSNGDYVPSVLEHNHAADGRFTG